jgi:hypothetical protein
MRATLVPHPATPDGPVRAMSVEIARHGRSLALRFLVAGDPDRMVWPPAAEAGRADGLWKHTCFEAFVSTDDGYREYNLSPSGQWASYRFRAYREGMAEAPETGTVVGLVIGPGQVALEARIELPPGAGRLALSAVIEADDGAIAYWALAHPSAKPDFHHPDSFVLDLP